MLKAVTSAQSLHSGQGLFSDDQDQGLRAKVKEKATAHCHQGTWRETGPKSSSTYHCINTL